ncbi:hypothetical protein BS78_02G258700 [Paspalum vaginatum]|nr:hypothetical protein BS78_02G258700 [Paspalum vaginatum]
MEAAPPPTPPPPGLRLLSTPPPPRDGAFLGWIRLTRHPLPILPPPRSSSGAAGVGARRQRGRACTTSWCAVRRRRRRHGMRGGTPGAAASLRRARRARGRWRPSASSPGTRPRATGTSSPRRRRHWSSCTTAGASYPGRTWTARCASRSSSASASSSKWSRCSGTGRERRKGTETLIRGECLDQDRRRGEILLCAHREERR